MIRVLHVIPSLGGGGIEQLTKQWYEPLKESSIEIIVSSHEPCGELADYLNDKKATIIKTGRISEIGLFSFVFQYIRIIKEQNVDIVDVPAAPSSPIVLMASLLAGCNIRVTHAHTNMFSLNKNSVIATFQLFFIRLFINSLSKIKISASIDAGRYCYGRSKYQIIKNGIDLEKMKFSNENRARIRMQFGINDDEFLVGNVGRLTSQKNQKFVIDVFREIKDTFPKSKLMLLGEGEDKQMLVDYLLSIGLMSDVVFCGYKQDLAPFYSAMDVFVFPSLFEGLGIAAVEAQTVGLPILLSTEVPSDTIISELSAVLNIKDGPKVWAKKALEYKGKRDYNATLAARNHGYDKKETTKQLIDIYKGIHNEREYKK